VLLAAFSASPVTLPPLLSPICSFSLSGFIVLCSGESPAIAVSLAVEGEVVLVSKQSGDFAHRESQLEEFLDPLQIGVKLAFLNGALRFA
jgi:hypothetical protein